MTTALDLQGIGTYPDPVYNFHTLFVHLNNEQVQQLNRREFSIYDYLGQTVIADCGACQREICMDLGIDLQQCTPLPGLMRGVFDGRWLQGMTPNSDPSTAESTNSFAAFGFRPGFGGLQYSTPLALVRLVDELLVPALRRFVFLLDDRVQRPNPERDSFYIWSFTDQFGRDRYQASLIEGPSELFGYQFLKQRLIAPRGRGVPIYDPSGRVTVAELSESEMTVFVPLDRSEPHREEIFRSILSLVSSVLAKPKDLDPAWDLEPQEIGRRIFIHQFRNSPQQEELNKAQSEWDHAREQEREIRKHLRTSAEALIDLQHRLSRPDLSIARLRMELVGEIEALATHPKIKAVRVTADELRVLTRPLKAWSGATQCLHELGSFFIVVSFVDGRASGVRCYNQTRIVNTERQGDMHAPHVFSGGDPCLGSLEDAIPALLEEKRLLEVINVLIRFLEHANEDDAAGIGVKEWPKAQRAQRSKTPIHGV